MANATFLHCMKDSIIHLFEGYEISKRMMEALEKKYDPKPDTHIQQLLDK
jgi:hypothetical protein